MRKEIIGGQYDEERAMYYLQQADLKGCVFAGPADGESALKEARDITVTDCHFSLRYPLWHVTGFTLTDSEMDEMTRAALWYAKDGRISNCALNGIKAVRECDHIEISDCEISSQEFGWKSRGISLANTRITSEYLFLDSRDISLSHVKMNGKYSFQYVEHLDVADSVLDTKDAFWHSKHVTVRNSIVKGEYLGWYSEDLTLIGCKIIGTQPLYCCKGLKLINCTMEDTDLAFEYSEVEAEVNGHIDSVRNPLAGTIICDSVGEVIMADAVMPCKGRVIVRE